jgi:hypothetical protein
MGLHLNYELRLPGSATSQQVTATVERLRAFALEIPFERVSEIYQAGPGGDFPLGEGLRTAASIIAEVFTDDTPPLISDIHTARGFSVLPGDGCETASFAFMKRAAQGGSDGEWFWHSSCKTQYASVISDRHLVACHTGLVKLLDYAIQIGVSVVVRDEAHYWETRDEQRLIAEVHAMNQIVAAFAGKLSDLGGLPDGRLCAPIFRHPRFERLEMGRDD